MKYLRTTAILVAGLGMSMNGVPALAATSSIHPDKIENDSQDITIPVTQSELDAEVSMEMAQRQRAEQPVGSVEFGVSSYSPSNLQTVSRIDNASSFGTNVPQMNLNGLTPLGKNFSLKVGVGFMAMDRTGTIGADGDNSTDQQTAYLISARVGTEYSPQSWAGTRFRPYLTAALLPTLVMTSRSSFDDGESQFGVPVELGVGTLYHLWKNLDVDVALTETLGKVQDSTMNGFAVNAGVRLPL